MAVRRGQIGDVEGIAEVVVKTWRGSLAKLVDQAFLDSLTIEGQIARHHRYLADRRVCYFVAEDINKNILGFISGGPDREDQFPKSAEIYGLYVLPDHQRLGIGAKLLQTLTISMQQDRFRHLFAWVLADSDFTSFYLNSGAIPGRVRYRSLGASVTKQVAYSWPNF